MPDKSQLQPISHVAGAPPALAGSLRASDSAKLRVFSIMVLFALSFGMAALTWVRFGQEVGIPTGLFTQTDFPAMTIASRLIAQGRGDELYNLDAQLVEQHALTREGYLQLDPNDPKLHYPYPYTPFIALLWSPFAGINPMTSMALWDLLNLVAFAGGLWVLLASLPLPGPGRVLLLLGGITSFAWIVNLEQGQSSGIVALGMALAVTLLRRGRDLSAGLAFGLLFVKAQWLPVLLLALLLGRRWRTLAGLGIAGAVLAAIATLALGPGWLPAYIDVLSTASRNGEVYLLTPAASHSLNGGIYALLGPGNAALVGPLNLLGTLLVVGLLAWVWLRLRATGTTDDGPRTTDNLQPSTLNLQAAWDACMGLTLLAAIFTNPQLNTHDLSLLVLPAALGFAAMAQRSGEDRSPDRMGLSWQACLWLLYFVPLFLTGALLDGANPLPVRLTTWLMGIMLGLLAIWTLRDNRGPAVTPGELSPGG